MYNEENQNYYQNSCQQTQTGDNGNKKKNSFGKKMTRCVAYALAFGLVAGTAFEGSSYAVQRLTGKSNQTVAQSTEQQTGSALPTTSVSTASGSIISTDVSEIAQNVMPSIVAITNMAEVQYNFFGFIQSGESESAGSGIIVAEDDDYLYIATNNHVVQGAETLTVQFNDDSTASAEVQGTDSTNDLAVVKVKKSDMEDGALDNIKIATLGDSTTTNVGEAAIAIGNALGYGQSVTTGVVSALDRLVTIQDETTGQTVSNKLIQTDAAINPGNSGGALLNAKGEVIGINSSKYSDTSVEGMGFAIPISTAKPIIDELVSTGKSTSAQGAYLGIAGVDVTKKESEAYNFPVGAYITKVEKDSAAANAGLSQGDIITAMDGTSVASFEELKAVMAGHRAGDVVTVTYQRRGNDGEYQENTVSITLGEYPQDATEEASTEDQSEAPRDNNNNRSLPDQLFPGLGQ